MTELKLINDIFSFYRDQEKTLNTKEWYYRHGHRNPVTGFEELCNSDLIVLKTKLHRASVMLIFRLIQCILDGVIDHEFSDIFTAILLVKGDRKNENRTVHENLESLVSELEELSGKDRLSFGVALPIPFGWTLDHGRLEEKYKDFKQVCLSLDDLNTNLIIPGYNSQ
uniref:Uncharacterized protein n=1 Tax=viral metagenome TaxID=1070528 RepID=A0A6C0AF11_9ZZZZ